MFLSGGGGMNKGLCSPYPCMTLPLIVTAAKLALHGMSSTRQYMLWIICILS